MNASSLNDPIGSGHSADVFRLPGRRVLKLFRAGVQPALMAREHDGASRAYEAGLPVARPIAWETIGDRTGIVFDEIEGPPLIAPGQAWRIDRVGAALRKLARCHADIHQCSAEGLHHLQHQLLRIRIERADVAPALREQALARLDALPQGDRLCHGDLHPGNVIETDGQVIAIDWANASAGDPAADVVRTEILLRYGRYGPLLRRFPLLRISRKLAADHYLAEYRRVTGMTLDHLATWWLPVAVSCLIRPSRIHHDALLADPRFERQD